MHKQSYPCPECKQLVPLDFELVPGGLVHCPSCSHDFSLAGRPSRRKGSFLIGLGFGVGTVCAACALSAIGLPWGPNQKPPAESAAAAVSHPIAVVPAAAKDSGVIAATDMTDQPGPESIVDSREVESATPSPSEVVEADIPGETIVEEADDGIAGLAALRYGWLPQSTYRYGYSVRATSPAGIHAVRGIHAFSVASVVGALRTPQAVPGSGSAFVISSDGHLVTCEHVIRNATQINVEIDKKVYPARVLAKEATLDLALLKIEAANLPRLSLAGEQRVEVGQDIRVAGFPLSDVLGASLKITRGAVSGSVKMHGRRLLQVDAAINPGNSGGPLLNERGEVVGVASQVVAGSELANLGFCIPVAELRRWLVAQHAEFVLGREGPELSGVEIAKQVSPAIALVRVMVIRDEDRAERLKLNGQGHMRTKLPGKSHEDVGQLDDGMAEVDVYGGIHETAAGLSLPSLMGRLSTLTVEPLPADGRHAWSELRAVELTRVIEAPHEPGRTIRPLNPIDRVLGRYGLLPGAGEDLFGGLDPFNPSTGIAPFRDLYGRRPAAPRRESITLSAFETLEYRITGVTESQVTIEKKMQLATLRRDEASGAVRLTGTGVLVFDRQEGVMESGVLDARLDVQLGSNREETAIQLKYQRLRGEGKGEELIDELTRTDSKQRVRYADEAIRILNDPLRKSDYLEALNVLLSQPPTPDRRQEFVQAVLPLLQGNDDDITGRAVRQLERWDPGNHIEAFILLLNDRTDGLRKTVMHVLQKYPQPRVAEAMAAQLSSPKVRHAAGGSLRKLGPVAEDAVLPLLSHDNQDTRMEAYRVLAEVGDQKSLEALQERLVTKDSSGNNYDANYIQRAIERLQTRLAIRK